MSALRWAPLVWKQVARRRARSALAVLGVAAAMFLFAAVRSVQSGVQEATARTARDTTLVVYRDQRFCPFTSRLPEDYGPKIARVPGVSRVTPMRIVVSNCRASLDVVTFRGVPREAFGAGEAAAFRVTGGSMQAWLARTDAALVGSTLAARRGWKPGDRFDANGITVTVAAIFDSDRAQDSNVAYVDLGFLQRAPGVEATGIVTQFNVEVEDPARLEGAASAIDAEFRTAQEPTRTRPEKEFTARAAGDVMELLGFARWVAAGCVLAVLALVANALVLSVQDRVRDFAVMQTLGFTGGLTAALVVAEGVLLGVAGGLLGTGSAVAFLAAARPSLSNEGISIGFSTGPEVWLSALLAAAAVGALAGVAPALQAARVPVAASFRAV